MNVLVYTTYHFNSETIGPYLEVIQKHLIENDEVEILTCKGELSACQINPNHSKIVCKLCTKMHINAFKCLEGSYNLEYLENSFKEFSRSQISQDIDDIEEFTSIYYKNFDIGLAVLSSLVSIIRDPNPDLSKHQLLINKLWNSSIDIYEAISSKLATGNYDVVYVFNARFANLRACLRACEAQKVKCMVLEEGRDRKSYSVFPNVLPHSRKYRTFLINELWENSTEDRVDVAQNYYNRRSQSIDIFNARFTENQELNLLPSSWDESCRNIVIFNSSEDEFVSVGKEWENELYPNQVTGISKIVKDLENENNFKVYLRIHPNLKGIYNESITKLFEIKAKNFEIILPESPISTYAMMASADVVLSFGSSAGIEAVIMNKPSILLGKCFYNDLGSTYNPSSHNEVIELVKNQNLEPKPVIGALKYGYMLARFGNDYQFFQRINTFEGRLNSKKFNAGELMTIIRKIGRKFRLFIKEREINSNIQKVKELI